MNILLVNPETPATFWSFRNALKFISKKSSEPPLGLLTVAAMLPASWTKKLIDMNIEPLKDKDMEWADYVFLTGMGIQKSSFNDVLRRCHLLKKKVVAGGPMVTMGYREFTGIDHFILNEAELTLPEFIADLQNDCAKPVYRSADFPPLEKALVPAWELLDMKKYASMSIQYSRGCPFNCDFCTITFLNGHKPRVKTTGQFIAELDQLYLCGWRGGVFIVDDNFIGNKKSVKHNLLPELIKWGEAHAFPFNFITEASINLADDVELVELMVRAGFDSAFIGIETVNEDSLAECGKLQNVNRDLVVSVKKLHQKGIRVSGGFIVGFDSDPQNIFEQMINFIQNSGIVTAMVGLLNAPTGTRLFQRLKSENRLLKDMTGNNMDGSLNFIPKMEEGKLLAGYKSILDTIYSQKEYYARVKNFLREYRVTHRGGKTFSIRNTQALFKSFWFLGVVEKGRTYYWRLLFFTIFRHPEKLALSVTLAIYGFHFRKVIQNI